MLEMVNVGSAMIESIGYEEGSKRLHINFVSTEKYIYQGVPNITGTQSDSLIYNGEGLRTQVVLNSVTSNYLYDGSNIVVERDGSNNTTKSYTRGLDVGGGIGSIINQNFTSNGNAVTQYYDYNDLGSSADLTTTSGNSAADYTYDAFGNLLTPQVSGDTNRYLFSSKEFDSRSGLAYFGNRYYDPEIGRWLTPDPSGFSDGLNLYTYVNNNPVNLVDPFGLSGDNSNGPINWSQLSSRSGLIAIGLTVVAVGCGAFGQLECSAPAALEAASFFGIVSGAAAATNALENHNPLGVITAVGSSFVGSSFEGYYGNVFNPVTANVIGQGAGQVVQSAGDQINTGSSTNANNNIYYGNVNTYNNLDINDSNLTASTSSLMNNYQPLQLPETINQAGKETSLI